MLDQIGIQIYSNQIGIQIYSNRMRIRSIFINTNEIRYPYSNDVYSVPNIQMITEYPLYPYRIWFK